VRLFSKRLQQTLNFVRPSVTSLAITAYATFLSLPHFDVICDLLLKRRAATWSVLALLTVGTFRLDYEYEIEYENDFSV